LVRMTTALVPQTTARLEARVLLPARPITTALAQVLLTAKGESRMILVHQAALAEQLQRATQRPMAQETLVQTTTAQETLAQTITAQETPALQTITAQETPALQTTTAQETLVPRTTTAQEIPVLRTHTDLAILALTNTALATLGLQTPTVRATMIAMAAVIRTPAAASLGTRLLVS